MNAQLTREFARRCQLGAVALAAATLTMQGSVHAATATTNLVVSATVISSCTITATQALAFGNYDPLSANATVPLDASGSISTTCTAGQNAVVTLSQGGHAISGSSATTPQRAMIRSGNPDVLAYFLYTDTGRAAVWGDTSPTGSPVSGSGLPQPMTVYGRVTSGQTIAPGSYTDTVVATITF